MTESEFACACATARHVARTLTQFYDRVLKDSGVEVPQFVLLTTIGQMGPCTQAAVGRRCALDKTTVSRHVRSLERAGWVVSTTGQNRRERRLTLTAEGRKRLAAAHPKWQQAQRRMRSAMSGAEWNAMFRAFRTTVDAADRAKRSYLAKVRTVER